MDAVNNSLPETPDGESSLTLLQWVRLRAETHGSRPAVSYVEGDGPLESITYRELADRTERLAVHLHQQLRALPKSSDGFQPPRVLLLYPAGIEFLIAFFAAQLADAIPVPTCFPKPHREMPRLNSAARDCRPSAILTDRRTLETIAREKLDESVRSVSIIATDDLDSAAAPECSFADIDSPGYWKTMNGVSFLQYTSGSTSEPKGVVVGQGNLVSNLESIRIGFGLNWASHEFDSGMDSIESGVFWLPFYHDMGLIGGILEALYIGGHSILMSPRNFLQRPIRWLKAMSDFRATISGAPNFAYQMCVDRVQPHQCDHFDLSRWRIAFCGAEPIAPRTLRDFASRFEGNGFRSASFYPCYGLAEATLLVAGGQGPSEPTVLNLDREAFEKGTIQPLDSADTTRRRKKRQQLVACGSAVANTEIQIVDPESHQPLGASQIGEIWVRGGGVTRGYWQTGGEPATLGRFEVDLKESGGGFCRSGDLGFIHDGNLYVTGRVKDLVILRGRNLFPQDIESTVVDGVRVEAQKIDPQLLPGLAVAFSVPGARSEALAIVVELPRGFDFDRCPELARQIRRNVIEVHDVDPHHIWMVRSAAIPVTTSGKVRRSDCRRSFLDDSLRTKYRYDRASFSEQVPIAFPDLPQDRQACDEDQVRESIERWMSDWLITRAGVPPEDLSRKKPLAEYGLDSMTAVELSGETEDWSGVVLTPEVAWENPTIENLSAFITSSYLAQQI